MLLPSYKYCQNNCLSVFFKQQCNKKEIYFFYNHAWQIYLRNKPNHGYRFLFICNLKFEYLSFVGAFSSVHLSTALRR